MRRAHTVPAAGRSEASELVTRHAELVKRIAYHLVGRLPPSVEVDDLMQAGMLGLLEAASNYAPNRGASFETYAGIRIRGAMIDALRKLDWAPRSVHRKARAVAAVVQEIERRPGATPAIRRSPSGSGCRSRSTTPSCRMRRAVAWRRSTIRRRRRPRARPTRSGRPRRKDSGTRWRRRSTGCRSARSW